MCNCRFLPKHDFYVRYELRTENLLKGDTKETSVYRSGTGVDCKKNQSFMVEVKRN